MRRVFEHDTGALLGGVMAANDNPKALAQYPAADLNARLAAGLVGRAGRPIGIGRKKALT